MRQFFVECISNGIIYFKSLSTLFVKFFRLKIKKFLNLEKLERMSTLKEKRFHLKKHFYQNGKAQNMPVVVSRLVSNSI